MKIKYLLGIFLLLVSNACSTTGGAVKITVQPVWGSPFCGGQSQPGMQMIVSETALKIWRSGQGQAVPQIKTDFGRHFLLLVNMGQQSTGGYNLSLIKEQADVIKDRLHISLRWQMPKPGMMQSQVITNPCLLIRVPKQHNFNTIVVFDQNAMKRFLLEM